jgi:Rod binding domain-containing protein
MILPEANLITSANADTAAAGNSPGVERKTSTSPDEEKLKKAAGDFESILLASMWKSMKQSFGSSEAESDPAHGTLDDWGIEVMSNAVGKAGGLGIGRLILNHLEPSLKSASVEMPTGAQGITGKQK